jgi:diamine N-acetyltransferase
LLGASAAAMGQRGGTALIRDAEPADAAGIAAIGRAAVPETYRALVDPAVLRSILEQSYSIAALEACIARCRDAWDAHFLLAEMDERVVGFLHYDCASAEPELHRIYVEPALKRRGIGSALLRELHRRLPVGASYMLMVVAANLAAVSFYQRHGFVEEARVDGPTYMSEHMGVRFPAGTRPAPALVLRLTKSRSASARNLGSEGGSHERLSR